MTRGKFMKKTIAGLFVLAAFAAAYAHPASNVTGKFDVENSVLTVDFEHGVKDKAQHFISIVSVELNGKEVVTQRLASQDDLAKGSLIYKISDAKPGDKIVVKTRCNKSGNKNLELTVQKEALKEVPDAKKAPLPR
jgi:hypothetical protein